MTTESLIKLAFEYRYLIIVFLTLLLITRALRRKKSRHSKKIKTADYVLKRISQFTPPQKLGYLRKIDPYSFEELIMTCLEKKGFPIKRNERYSNDGGIDGRFFVNGEMYLIQAKRYQKDIRYDHLEEFSNILEKNNCKGLFVHTGKTPKNISLRNINMEKITIISGGRLLELLNSEIKLKF
ncbi:MULTISPECIES: restriction endonuclease [Erwiniaceae]|uniref:restriction endonuclease n=1 Tax=Erwiniaceae TaxID=1903409 RepID=UPI00226B5AFA|nr:restriction endonuclease [Erwinia psidii]MCX8966586.1 restriction endonuclease [Erwinia psidii]